MMKLRVNGQERDLESPITLSKLLEQFHINPQSVVVERNKSVVARTDFASMQLEEGDQIEIVQFVGGGN